MRVAICGAGVAGVTLACQLVERGHDVHLIERAPRLRDGGYMIDFFGPGYDTAERMGLLGSLARIHQPIEHLIFVDGPGRERLRVPYPDLRAAFDGRHFNFPRGDLVRVLYERLGGRGRTSFGATVRSYVQQDGTIDLHLDNGERYECDLLVGADGIHSRVRRLLLENGRGADDPLRFLGFHAMAFRVDARHVPELRESALYLWSAPGHTAMACPERGGVSVFLAHQGDAPPPDTDRARMRSILQERYSDAGWIFAGLIDGFDRATDLYFDEVSQVQLGHWHQGRVALLGDACQCVSLLAGQGASLAMGGAEVLARQLDAAPSIEDALAAYQARMQPSVARKQQAGRRIAAWFVPATPRHVVMSRMFMRMLRVPGLRKLAARGVDSSAIGNV